MRRGLLSALALLLAPAGIGAPATASGPPPAEREETAVPARAAATSAEFAAALLKETNRVRALHGRRALTPHPKLDAAADDQATFMAMATTAQHTSPILRQRTAVERVDRQGLSVEGARLAENVASFPVGRDPQPPPVAEIAAVLVEQWMNSPGHRANLLSRDFTQLGGSVRLTRVLGSVWCAYGVQVFYTARDPFARLP